MIKTSFVCNYQQLKQQPFLLCDIALKGKDETAIVFCFEDEVFAYLNRCVHMPRALTCQKEAIFDESEKLLRCSMHGFVYEPKTGECLSPVCSGQKLQKLKLKLENDSVYFAEKHLTLKEPK